ncbi:class I SAM-dependent methyltransferase [Mycobacteroides chelonae]
MKNGRIEQNNLLPAVGIAPNIGNMPTFDVNAVDWDELYRGEAVYAPGDPGWNIGEMQPEIAALHRQGRFESPILDSGCGVGLTSLKLAGHGYQVVGLDLSGSAIDKAQRAAAQLGLDAIFNTADLTADTGYHNYFNTVIDGLVFHCLPDELRESYVRSLARALRPGGKFFALVFATEAFPPDAEFGPRPFTEQQLHSIVGRHLVIDEIRRARAWVNVPSQLPEGFEYRGVTIGSDGRAQLPAWLVSAHRSL